MFSISTELQRVYVYYGLDALEVMTGTSLTFGYGTVQWDQSDRFLKNWVKEVYNGKQIYHFTDKFSNDTIIKWFQDGYDFLMPSNLLGNFRNYYQYCDAVKVPLPQ